MIDWNEVEKDIKKVFNNDIYRISFHGDKNSTGGRVELSNGVIYPKLVEKWIKEIKENIKNLIAKEFKLVASGLLKYKNCDRGMFINCQSVDDLFYKFNDKNISIYIGENEN